MRPRGAHRRTSKFGSTGRHCAPPKAASKKVKLAGAAIPAVALAGALAASAFHPHQAGAATGSVDSYVAPLSPAGAAAGHLRGGWVSQLDTTASLRAAARAKTGRARPATSGRHRAAGQGPDHRGAQSTSKPGRHAAHSPAVSAQPPAACSGNGQADQSLLPANYAAIVDFLTAHGYSDMAAAGIAGNIYQESGGNPEAIGTGGGGLIGWTPLPAGYVTGDPAADLQTQLTALLGYDEQWAEYIPALNAATSPAQAADIFMDDFERPGLPAAANRESAAIAVAQACGFG